MILLGIILFFTILEAVHEGLHLRGWKTIASYVEYLKLIGIPAMVLFLPWLLQSDPKLWDYYSNPYHWHFWRFLLPELIIGWLCIRFGIFNPIHNLAAGLKVSYLGSTKNIDKLEKWIFRNQYPGPSFWVPRLVLLLLGVGLVLNI
jgi:hypothetical protein